MYIGDGAPKPVPRPMLLVPGAYGAPESEPDIDERVWTVRGKVGAAEAGGPAGAGARRASIRAGSSSSLLSFIP